MIDVSQRKNIAECEFFKNRQIEITSIYKSDPLEKCFLVTDRHSGKKYKVRIARKEFPTNVESEYKALAFLKSCKLDWIPEIYYSSIKDEKSILIYEFFEGESIDKLGNRLGQEDLKVIKSRLVQMIYDMQSIVVSNFGDFAGNNFTSWTEYFKLKLFCHVDNAYTIGIVSTSEYEIIKTAFSDNTSYYNNVKSSFLHFDIKPANIVYDIPTKKTQLVDFELCRMGDKLMEYVRFTTCYNEPDYLHYGLFIPLANEYLGSDTNPIYQSKEYCLYDLYNLLAYYTTSQLKHGIKRIHLLEPIKRDINRLKKD